MCIFFRAIQTFLSRVVSFTFYSKYFTQINHEYTDTKLSKIHIKSKMHCYPIPAKPDKPSIGQQLQTVEGYTVKYTCTGNVGNLPGSIEFLVRKNGEENFTVSSIA